eukprot:PhF_6_TR13415/c0_g1_i3/m.21370
MLSYHPQTAHTFTMEKCAKTTKFWSKKFWKLQGLQLSYKDSEKDEKYKQSIEIAKLSRTAEKEGGDLYGIIIEAAPAVGSSSSGKDQKVEKWYVRVADTELFTEVHKLLVAALVHWGKLEDPSYGLPAADPRTNLPFVDVPLEHLMRFALLGKAVMHYFGEVTEKFVPAKKAKPFVTDRRVVVVSDKNLYVCKNTSDITRCIKITDIQQIYYHPPAVGIQVEHGSNEFDVFFTDMANIELFIKSVATLFTYLTHGKILPVSSFPSVGSIDAEMHLGRPEGYQMQLALPTSKKNLKKALDVFAQKVRQMLADGQLDAATAANNPLVLQYLQQMQQQQGGSGGVSLLPTLAPPSNIPKTNPVGLFLIHLKLDRLYHVLTSRKVDWDVLHFVELPDLEAFGVSDPADRATIMNAIHNTEFMEQVERQANEYAKQVNSSVGGGGGAGDVVQLSVTQPAATTTMTPTKPVDTRKPIILDDDDDILAATTKGGPPKPKPKISLDDDDDDIILPPKGAATVPVAKKPIALDDDDDDDIILPPKGTGAPASKPKANFSLDDDDDDIILPPKSLNQTVSKGGPPIKLDDDDDDVVLPPPKPKSGLMDL